MADILSNEEIDALLDAVDNDGEYEYPPTFPLWALTKYKEEFEIHHFTRDTIRDLLKYLDIYSYDTELNDNKVTENYSFQSISSALKDVGYHLIISDISERNFTLKLRDEQRNREFLKGSDRIMNVWIDDNPQHLI